MGFPPIAVMSLILTNTLLQPANHGSLSTKLGLIPSLAINNKPDCCGITAASSPSIADLPSSLNGLCEKVFAAL